MSRRPISCRSSSAPTDGSLESIPTGLTTTLRGRLQLLQDALVFAVGANEEPDHRVRLQQPDGTPVKIDSYREDWERRVNLLESERRVLGILGPELMRLPDLDLGGRRRRGKLLTEALGGCRLQLPLPRLGTSRVMLGQGFFGELR